MEYIAISFFQTYPGKFTVRYIHAHKKKFKKKFQDSSVSAVIGYMLNDHSSITNRLFLFTTTSS